MHIRLRGRERESAQKDQVRGCKPDPVHSADAGLYVSWVWLLVTMLSITVFVFLMDEVSQVMPDKESTGWVLRRMPAAVHFPMLALGVGGGVNTYIGIAIFAQIQLLLSDYVPHDGLRRRATEMGEYETIGPQHRWNARKWYSSVMMLYAPRLSDHQMRPARA